MFDQVLDLFEMWPDYDLDIMHRKVAVGKLALNRFTAGGRKVSDSAP